MFIRNTSRYSRALGKYCYAYEDAWLKAWYSVDVAHLAVAVYRFVRDNDREAKKTFGH
jgi:hypothetical protein